MGVTWVNPDHGSIYQQYVSGRVSITFRKCGNCGAHVAPGDIKQHEAFHETFSNRKDATMSKVLWCDRGDHPFKAGALGSSNFEGTMIDDNGINQHVSEDVCADHNPLNAAKREAEARRAIEAELRRDYPTTPVSAPPFTD